MYLGSQNSGVYSMKRMQDCCGASRGEVDGLRMLLEEEGKMEKTGD